MRRSLHLATVLAAMIALVMSVGAPAVSHPESGDSTASSEEGGDSHLQNPREGLFEVGFHPLNDKSFNSDIWAWTDADDRLFAATGTWGTLSTAAGTDDCPSDDDSQSDPQRSGVWIVEATDPSEPELASKLPDVPGAHSNDIKVLTGVSTEGFEGDLLAHSIEPCGAAFGPSLVPVTDEFPSQLTGFRLYDVSDPHDPEQLGDFNNGGFGTHNLYLFARPDLGATYSATVFNQSNVSQDDSRGVVQMVDVSDPNGPQLVAEWELADAEAQGGPPLEELCQRRGNHLPSCNLHDLWVSDDGTILYASYWDAGLVLLDISDPTDPQFIGQTQPGGTDNEGNTHVAVPYEIDGEDHVIVGDEDFVGPGPVPHVIVNEAPGDADVSADEAWGGTEQTDTRPLAEVAPLGPGLAFEADSHETCTFTQASAAASGEDVWFGVVKRGTCPFQTMVSNAESAGADGVIIVNNVEGRTAGTAAGDIPALMIEQEPGDRLLASISPTSSDVRVTLDLLPPDGIDPWGFMRVVKVGDLDDPSTWTQVSTFKAPHVDTLEGQGPENTFSAHNPIVGPDGRVYFAWYTNGVRVLEPSGTGGEFEEVASFVPLPSDHEDDNDSDPNGIAEDNAGFWGSMAITHPRTGDVLVFNSDRNRGIYILGYLEEDATIRLSGDDRWSTAVDISKDRFPTDGSADTVVLARGDDPEGYADALAGTPLSVCKDAPLLITTQHELLPEVEAEIERALGEDGTVILLGLTEALDDGVEQSVRDLGYSTERIGGAERIATSIEVAETIESDCYEPDNVLIARAFEFADALTGGAAAASQNGVIVLNQDESRNEQVESYLDGHRAAADYALGGQIAALYPEATGLFGATRIETAVEVSEEFFDEPQVVGTARAWKFPDSLTGGAHIGARAGSMLLTHDAARAASSGEAVAPATEKYLCENADAIATAYIYGGIVAISAGTETAIDDRISGQGC